MLFVIDSLQIHGTTCKNIQDLWTTHQIQRRCQVHPALKSKRQKCSLVFLKNFCVPRNLFSCHDCAFSFFRLFFFFFSSPALLLRVPVSFFSSPVDSACVVVSSSSSSPWFCAFRRHCRGKLCSPSPWCPLCFFFHCGWCTFSMASFDPHWRLVDPHQTQVRCR